MYLKVYTSSSTLIFGNACIIDTEADDDSLNTTLFSLKCLIN